MGLVINLMERDEHLQQLDHLLSDSLARRGRAALMEGPIGTGRTVLLPCLAEQAEKSGFRWLSAACSPMERELPYGVAGQLLHGLPRPDAQDTTAGPSLDDLLAAASAAAAEP